MGAGCQEIRGLELPDLLEGEGQGNWGQPPQRLKGWVQRASGWWTCGGAESGVPTEGMEALHQLPTEALIGWKDDT